MVRERCRELSRSLFYPLSSLFLSPFLSVFFCDRRISKPTTVIKTIFNWKAMLKNTRTILISRHSLINSLFRVTRGTVGIFKSSSPRQRGELTRPSIRVDTRRHALPVRLPRVCTLEFRNSRKMRTREVGEKEKRRETQCTETNGEFLPLAAFWPVSRLERLGSSGKTITVSCGLTSTGDVKVH